LAERLDRKYRDIILSTKMHQSPTSLHSVTKKKYEEKTENVLSIIKSCETLRESYRNTHHNWMRSIEKEESGIHEKHHNLGKQTV
jgi:hypothetical protein